VNIPDNFTVILHIPECDLPQRMLPDDNSSNSFVKSAHHGDENIKKRWIEDRAVKAGYPIRAVKRCTSNKRQADNWELTLASLNRMLIGKPLPDAAYMSLENITEEMIVQDDDLEALWGSWAEPGELVLPINTADIKLHFLSPPESPHLTARHPPPMFISSATVAPYVRLHLLSVLLNAIVNQEVMESGTGLLVEAMGVLDGEWTRIEEEGPPDMWEVLKHLLPPPETGPRATGEKGELKPLGTKGRRKNAGRRLDPRTNEQVLKDFNKVRAEDKYAKLLQTRERLPSFTAKNELLSMLENHRAIVIVGETGMPWPCSTVMCILNKY
jgi:ATP-dependent RNA helicase DHX57